VKKNVVRLYYKILKNVKNAVLGFSFVAPLHFESTLLRKSMPIEIRVRGATVAFLLPWLLPILLLLLAGWLAYQTTAAS